MIKASASLASISLSLLVSFWTIASASLGRSEAKSAFALFKRVGSWPGSFSNARSSCSIACSFSFICRWIAPSVWRSNGESSNIRSTSKKSFASSYFPSLRMEKPKKRISSMRSLPQPRSSVHLFDAKTTPVRTA